MRIGVIHATVNAIEPLTRAFREADPSITICNFVNEELLYHANQHHGVDAWGIRNFLRLAMQAAESSVDGIVIACSLYSGLAEKVQVLTNKPVIAIDQPMIDQAVLDGSHIGIMATTASAGPETERKVLAAAMHAGKEIKTSVAVNTAAMEALKAGDENKSFELLREMAQALKQQGCDTLLLSQITMAGAANLLNDCGMRVFASPQSGAAYMLARIEESR